MKDCRFLTKLMMATFILAALWSCDDYETYGDKKDKERDAIAKFISSNNITAITEDEFVLKGCTTDTARHEYVYLTKSGIWMQIIRKGEGEKIENQKRVNVLVRFEEYDFLNGNVLTNLNSSYIYDKMTVYRDGSTYTASFVSGVMASTYSASVPTGWLVPLDYVTLARPTSDQALAEVRLIVPHSQGTSQAQSYVYPCHYQISYEREK